MMARQSSFSNHVLRRAAAPLVMSLGVSFAIMAGGASAAQTGHGRVNSQPGAPLEVSIPLRGLTADDLKVLNASVADPSAWAQAGLTLPAAIESLSVSVEPGFDPSSRTLVLKSSQAVNRPVIDVLIRLSTASGARSVQSSYLVLAQDSAAGSASTVRVARGDTLYAIALTKAVSNADIYQVMWAIYEANAKAFISDNMNLLRAGTTLNIPDAATIRAVDAKYARAMFAKHDQAFRSRRGAGQTSAAVPVVATASAQSGALTAPSSSPSAVAAGDQVRLDSTSPSDQQADVRVASANELREMQSRVEALQKNVEELKVALQKSQANAGATSSTGAAGSSGARGESGATGAIGSTGTPGVSGPMGAVGASVASGATGASSAESTARAAGASSAGATQGASGATATSKVVPAQDTGVAAANEVKTGLAKAKQFASDHVLGLVLGISALLALLIAFLLKLAGKNARAEELDQVPREHPGLASDFDQKLQSIDLNLSIEDKPALTPGSTKTGV